MRKLSLALLLLTAACTVGPQPESVKTSVPPSGAFVTTANGVSAAPADASAELSAWWRLYDDPLLDTLVQEAFTANRDFRAALANLEAARAILSEARAVRRPQTAVAGGVSYGDGSANGMAVSDDARLSYDAGVQLAWEADLFGRLRRAAQTAQHNAEAARAEADAVRVLVAANVSRAYFSACSFAQMADVARTSLDIANDSLRLVKERHRHGAASQLDVEQAASAAAAAKAAIPPLERQRSIALFELAALLGRIPADIPAAAANCVRPPEVRSTIPVGDGTSLLRRRPDVRVAERQLAASVARIGVAMADLYPSVRLGGSAGYFGSSDDREGNAFAFSVGPLISWSFPNVSVARARIRQAEARADASLAALDKTVLTALKEVEQALTAIKNEQERIGALDESALRAGNAYRLAEARYRSGSIAYLDVLVAQRAFLDARLAVADANRQMAELRVDLFKALGGGWEQQLPASQ